MKLDYDGVSIRFWGIHRLEIQTYIVGGKLNVQRGVGEFRNALKAFRNDGAEFPNTHMAVTGPIQKLKPSFVPSFNVAATVDPF